MGDLEKIVKKAAKTTAKAAVNPYGVPWTIAIGLAGGTEVAHLTIGDDPVLLASTVALGSVSAVGLTAFVRQAVRKTSRITRDLYTVNTAAGGAGVIAGTIAGLETPQVGLSWLIGGIALCAATNIRRLIRQAGQELDEKNNAGALEKLAERVGMERYQLKQIQGNGKGVVTAKVKALNGATVEEFAAKIPALAAGLGLGRGRLTVTPDPDDSSSFELRATVADLLKNVVWWSGPAHPGAGIVEQPIPFGLYEDGEVAALHLLDEHGDITHLLIMGVTGAGKSEFFRVVMGEVLCRREVSVIGVDCSKGLQTFGPIRHGLEWAITDPREARAFLKLLPEAIRARADYLGRKGLAKWVPGCGLNFLIVWLEEAADFAASSEAYNHMLRAARSAGVWIVTSLQRASHTNISTDARANHGSSMCFGVSKLGGMSDAMFALPDEVIEAGANPAWGKDRPGCAYLAGMGAPPERWAMVLRGWRVDEAMLADRITAGAVFRVPLDEVTATAFGALYANRTVYSTPLLPDTPTIATAPPAAGTVAGDDADGVPDWEEIPDMPEAERAEFEELAAMLSELEAMNPEPDAPYANATLDTPIQINEGEPVMTFDTEPKVSVEEARARLDRQLHDWLTSGKTSFRPAELAELIEQVGRGRRWFYRERDRLVEAGIIAADEEEFGAYLILRSPLDNPPAADTDGGEE